MLTVHCYRCEIRNRVIKISRLKTGPELGLWLIGLTGASTLRLICMHGSHIHQRLQYCNDDCGIQFLGTDICFLLRLRALPKCEASVCLLRIEKNATPSKRIFSSISTSPGRQVVVQIASLRANSFVSFLSYLFQPLTTRRHYIYPDQTIEDLNLVVRQDFQQ